MNKRQIVGRALLSVTDKTGIVALARRLVYRDWEVISTGGTEKVISGDKNPIPCTLVETVTGFPEMLDGRLKTLHPKVFGGILANRAIPAHMQAIKDAGIMPIDLVAVNLYAFDKKPDIENIDIGGPTLLRAAAKNAASVIVMVDPEDYGWVIEKLDAGTFSERDRASLAMKVFVHTAAYDKAIAAWMAEKYNSQAPFLTSALPVGH